MLGFASATFAQTVTVPEVDYNSMIATFAGFVGGVVLLIEGIKTLFPKMEGLTTQIVSWCVGIVAAVLLWWLDVGFVSGMTWYMAFALRFRFFFSGKWRGGHRADSVASWTVCG